MVPGFMKEQTIEQSIEVPVTTLTEYVEANALENIKMIKIDTEGFEYPVLKGLSGYFEKSTRRPAILCEIAPSAYPLLGYTLAELSKYMQDKGYCACSLLDPQSRTEITALQGTTNVLFLGAGDARPGQ